MTNGTWYFYLVAQLCWSSNSLNGMVEASCVARSHDLSTASELQSCVHLDSAERCAAWGSQLWRSPD